MVLEVAEEPLLVEVAEKLVVIVANVQLSELNDLMVEEDLTTIVLGANLTVKIAF